MESNGLDLVKTLRKRSAEVKTIVFTSRPAWVLAERLLAAGASGYLRKSSGDQQILQAIREVVAGRTFVSEGSTPSTEVEDRFGESVRKLSDQEYQVFDLTGQGLEATEIAGRLDCSVNTVRTKIERLKKKLGHQRMSELRRAAISWQIDLRL